MEQPQHTLRHNAAKAKSPVQKTVSVGIVVGLHFGILLALAAGLANRSAFKAPEPIVVDVTPPKLPDEAPPPPPPETVKPPPPVVPPPDIVITQEMAPPPPITAAISRPAPPPAATDPMAGVTAPARSRGQNCSTDFYPQLSARMHEEGTTSLSFIIQADGRIKDVAVKKSSGKPRLDEAALACAKTWRYTPAQKDGQPVDFPWTTDVVWKLGG